MVKKWKLLAVLLLFCTTQSFVLQGAHFQSGSGTEQAPYQISTAQELAALANYLGTEHAQVYFELSNNIDLSDYLSGKAAGWEPLGREAADAFYGKLDGKNHRITNLYIAKDDAINVGLFGYVAKSAVIKNLHVATDARGIISKFSQAGILAGCVGTEGSTVGEIAYCSVSGLVQDWAGTDVWTLGGMIGRNNGYVHHCSATDLEVRAYGQLGGLIGVNAPYYPLHDCTLTVVMNARWSNVGGLIGKNLQVSSPKNISNCHVNVIINNPNRGYLGGLIGQNVSEGDVINCSVLGEINGVDNETGGFIGRNSGGDSGAASPIYAGGVIRNCWFLGTVSGKQYVGGFVGRNYKRIVNCFAIADVKASDGYSGGFVGINYNRVDSSHFSGFTSWDGAGAVGGFLGRNYDEPVNNNGGTIANCVSMANVIKLSNAKDTYIGKFFGGQTTPLTSGAIVNGKAIWDSYYQLNISGYPGTQGTIPANQAGATTTALNTSMAKAAASYPTLQFTNNTWAIWEGKSTPYFTWQTTPVNITKIENTSITVEAKETLGSADSFALYANGEPVTIQSSTLTGTTWKGNFASGTLYDGAVVMLVRMTSGKAPAASSALYETGTDGFVDAQNLTVIGQAVPLANYHRINTDNYPNVTSAVKTLLTNGAGIAVLFKTNSSKIQVRWTTGATSNRTYVNPILEKGLDLYIKRDNQWVWAGVARKTATTTTAVIVENMDLTEKECMLYLPVYEEVTDLKIGVDAGRSLQAIPSPFKGKVIMYGTSIMQGASASRPGMAYPARLTRATGINFINVGLSGSGTMPQADADMIASLDADAYVMDCTQNGSVSTVQSNTEYMVRKIRAAHPNAPIIMKAGEKRITGNFDETRRTYWAGVYAAFKAEYERLSTGANAVPNLHFIEDTGFYGDDWEASQDGTHPTDVGFTRMLSIIQPQLVNILTTLPVFQ